MDTMISHCTANSVGPANQLITLLLQSLLSAQCSLIPLDMWPKDYGPIAVKEGGLQPYDFIIIGAGSAGSVLANRLSEHSDSKILLLEAGADPPIESEIPSLAPSLWSSTVDWNYYLTKSNNSCIATRTECFWPRGKMLGGSSSLNSMSYTRGNERDYDRWASMGNPTWEWKNVLTYFKKSESMKAEEILNSNYRQYHGTDGPIPVNQFKNSDPFRKILIDAAEELGYGTIIDLNEDHIGLAVGLGTIHNGKRFSTAKAFLFPVKDRENLHIIKNAHVTKIEFNEHRESVGVKFLLNGKEYIAKNRKDVILSAGAIGTPQLLMLSGIGPAKHLIEHNIPVIQNLSVGYNLRDHVAFPFFVKVPNNDTSSNSIDNLLTEYFHYLVTNSGSFAGSGIFDILAYYNVDNINDRYPHIQVAHIIFKKGNYDIIKQELQNIANYEDSIVKQLVDVNKDYDVIAFMIILLKPESQGRILLQDVNPLNYPIIKSNYLSHPEDLRILLRGLKLHQNFLNTKTFQKNVIEFVKINLPKCPTYETDEYWECYIRHLTKTAFHPIGTAKMGPEFDEQSVVDPRLRVRGIKKLRVVDASIMPDEISGNINAPTIMIAEKAADFIKEDWNFMTIV